MNKFVLLYGATGYTGRLIIEEAIRKGLPLILAGRNEQALRELAIENNLSYRVAPLDDSNRLDNSLQDVAVVLHAAGPFAITAEPMIAACIRNKVHYLDITGEIGVFEYAHRMSNLARDAGIMLLPGCGFDVVPTDS